MKCLRVIFESSNGKKIELYDYPYRLYRFEGFGDVEADTQIQRSPYQDGGRYVDSILEPKPITLELKISASSEKELMALKRNLTSAFNPKLGIGKLARIIEGDVKEILVVVDGSPFFPDGNLNRGPLFQKALIHLIAPDPYWRDPAEVSRSLRAYEGHFEFPFEFPVEFGIEGDITTLTNDGDTSAPVIITIRGPIRRPMIENRTTGEFIRINASISAEEILYIDTNPQGKRAEIHRGNQIIKAMGYMDHLSDFWQLKEGENELRYTADEGLAEAIAAISWYNKYVGV